MPGDTDDDQDIYLLFRGRVQNDGSDPRDARKVVEEYRLRILRQSPSKECGYSECISSSIFELLIDACLSQG